MAEQKPDSVICKKEVTDVANQEGGASKRLNMILKLLCDQKM